MNINLKKRTIRKLVHIISLPYRFVIDIPRNFILSAITYYSLKKRKRAEESIFILSCSLGDVVFGMAYLKAYKNKNPGKQILLIAEEKTRSIIEAFTSYDKVLYYNTKEKWGKRYLLILNGSKFFYKKGMAAEIFNTIPWVGHGYEYGTCLNLLKQDFSLLESAVIDYPLLNARKVTTIENFEANKHKIAIVNPYAHNDNICECPRELEVIISLLHQKGYTVYCNVITGQDVLNDTIPLNCDLAEFYAIADSIPLIISVRTGLIDWVITTKSKKIVLDPRGFNNKARASFYRFYALYQWKQDNVLEIALPDKNLINSIETFI